MTEKNILADTDKPADTDQPLAEVNPETDGNTTAGENSDIAEQTAPQALFEPAEIDTQLPPEYSINSTPWSVRKFTTMGIIGLAVLLGGFGSWSVFSSISGAIIAPGMLEVESNRQVVQHPHGGVIKDILVSEGDLVEKGDELIILDPDAVASELAVTENMLFDARAIIARLEAELAGETSFRFPADMQQRAAKDGKVAALLANQYNLFNARNTLITQQADQLQRRKVQTLDQIKGYKSELKARKKQLTLVKQELEIKQGLNKKGYTSLLQVLQIERAAVDLEGQIGQLTASIAQAEGLLTQLDIAMVEAAAEQEELALADLIKVKTDETSLREQYHILKDKLDNMTVRAPVSGLIYGLKFFALKAVVKPADEILFLVPQNQPLVITSQIPTSNVDQVYIGQNATLRFTAFSLSNTPELNGQVTHVSADAIVDPLTGTAVYEVSIMPEISELDKLDRELRLVPGMPVEAFIKTRDRSPLVYFLKPFTDYFARAFREE